MLFYVPYHTSLYEYLLPLVLKLCSSVDYYTIPSLHPPFARHAPLNRHDRQSLFPPSTLPTLPTLAFAFNFSTSQLLYLFFSTTNSVPAHSFLLLLCLLFALSVPNNPPLSSRRPCFHSRQTFETSSETSLSSLYPPLPWPRYPRHHGRLPSRASRTVCHIRPRCVEGMFLMSCRLLPTLPITLTAMLILCRPASLRRPRNQWPAASSSPETLPPALDVSKQTPCRAPGPQDLVRLPELRRPRALRPRPALAHCA